MNTRVPDAFQFVEEDPELGNMAPPDAWAALVKKLEDLGDGEILVRCGVGHSWKALVHVDGRNGFVPEICPKAACQIPSPVLTMRRKSIETIRKLAALPDGHRLGRCLEGHEWDADSETPLDVRPESPLILRCADGRPACPYCLGPADVCFVSSPLSFGGTT